MERRRSGRPAHEPTEASRAQVRKLIGAGSAIVAVAKAIGLSAPTLRAHYAEEILAARPQKSFAGEEFQEAGPRPGRERAGRPEHVPTDESRARVEELVAFMPQWQIAQVLGISEPVLRDRYAEQLAIGRSKTRAEVLGLTLTAARAGNVAAQKALLGMTMETEDPPPLPPAREEPLGKKEQQNLAALKAHEGTEWERLLPN